ncbi:hypothetical protein N7U49_46245 [Streptomyces sp. AD2-2]|nr:hypothetical protein N7U49_46245 [Streptomyces sp. AD2-2]
MTIVLSTPTADGACEAMAALREWPQDIAPTQLHPGDIGWNYRSGTAETHALLRTWSQDGHIQTHPRRRGAGFTEAGGGDGRSRRLP